MVKKCADTVDRPLEILLNVSLEEDVVPREWRRTNVVPLFKKGDIGKLR